MSEVMHTQGRWSASESISVFGMLHYGVEIPGTGKVVAITGIYAAKDHEESIANSRLIAAAPELLAVTQEVEQLEQIRAVQNALEQQRVKGSFRIAVADDEQALEWQKLEQQAAEINARRRAAIAKALGEQS